MNFPLLRLQRLDLPGKCCDQWTQSNCIFHRSVNVQMSWRQRIASWTGSGTKTETAGQRTSVPCVSVRWACALSVQDGVINKMMSWLGVGTHVISRVDILKFKLQYWPRLFWLDNAIYRINHYPADAWFVLLTLIRRIAIYLVDSVYQPLNNRGQHYKFLYSCPNIKMKANLKQNAVKLTASKIAS